MVAIKNTELPKSCAHCDMTYEDRDYRDICFCTGEYVGHNISNQTKLDNCPLVEIVTCKDCNQVNCLHHVETCDPEEYRPDFFCADAKRSE